MNQFNIAILAVILSLSAAAVAEEPNDGYLTAEQYIEQASPFLHLSCEGAWNNVNEDPDAYIDIVNKLAAIGFINHSFDIAKMEALPAEELEAVRTEYYNEIGRLCMESPSMLLAGVVENALIDTFSSLMAE
jgi:hypothetical protein